MKKGRKEKGRRKSKIERDMDRVEEIYWKIKNDPVAMKQIREKLLAPIA